MNSDLEVLWSHLLSGDPVRIRGALARLGAEERRGVLEHLQRMATEDGWSQGQRSRAQAALRAAEEI